MDNPDWQKIMERNRQEIRQKQIDKMFHDKRKKAREEAAARRSHDQMILENRLLNPRQENEDFQPRIHYPLAVVQNHRQPREVLDNSLTHFLRFLEERKKQEQEKKFQHKELAEREVNIDPEEDAFRAYKEDLRKKQQISLLREKQHDWARPNKQVHNSRELQHQKRPVNFSNRNQILNKMEESQLNYEKKIPSQRLQPQHDQNRLEGHQTSHLLVQISWMVLIISLVAFILLQ